MDSGFTELASVDGTITPVAAATIPLKDDGLYRGDGAFEVMTVDEYLRGPVVTRASDATGPVLRQGATEPEEAML